MPTCPPPTCLPPPMPFPYLPPFPLSPGGKYPGEEAAFTSLDSCPQRCWGAVEWAPGQPGVFCLSQQPALRGVFAQPRPFRRGSFSWTDCVKSPPSVAARLGRGRGKPWLLIGRMTHLPGTAGIRNCGFHLGAILLFMGHLTMSGDCFWLSHWSGVVPLASSR